LDPLPAGGGLVAGGVLPQPTPIPSRAVPCMRGKLVQEGARHVCKGVWAKERDDHFGGDSTWPFVFSIVPPATVQLPADGQYDGLFGMVTKRGYHKYKDSSILAFTPNSCGGWNISGHGWNKAGEFQVTGTVTADRELELFRSFEQDRGGQGRDRRGQQQPPPLPIVTAPALAPFPREPIFTSSATAGAGAGSSSVDDPTTGDDEDKVGWRGA
jgi:hypothetical protein